MALLTAGAVVCIVALALTTLPAPSGPTSRPLPSRGVLGESHLAAGPQIRLAPTASPGLAGSERSFWPRRLAASLLTEGGGIHSTFTASGVSLRVAQGTLTLSLAAVGRGHRVEHVAARRPSALGSQVVYRNGSVTELYRNGPHGLEQGFTLRHRPRGGAGSLVLAQAIGGALPATQMGSQVLFGAHERATGLRYGQLSAFDATGRRLPAKIHLRNRSLDLRIDDSHARYPLRIDPFILTALSSASVETANIHPIAIAISPDGRSAYVGYEEGQTISQYGRNTETGALTALSPATVETGNEPRVVTVSPDGKSVYVANFASGGGSSSISQYSRDMETGELTALSPATVELGNSFWPHGLRVSPDGKSVYVANYNDASISQFSRSPETGALTALSPAKVPSGFRPNGIAISSDGTSVYTANRESNSVSQYSRDLATGKLTPLSPASVQAGQSPHEIAISPDGKSVYVPNAGSNSVSQYSRNAQTGMLTGLSPAMVEAGGEPFGVDVSSDNQSVYVTDSASNALSQYSRNPETGALTASSPATVETGAEPYGVTVSLDGHSVYVTNKGSRTVSQYSRAWLPNPPVVVTGTALSVTQSEAVLSASVNPNGGEVSDCRFEYGASEGYGLSTPCSSLPGSGTSPVAVSASVAGLSASTSYHFRITARHAGGTGKGGDQTFTTLPAVLLAAPSISRLKETAKIWREGSALAHVSAGTGKKKRLPVGTTFSFGLNQPASVIFSFTQWASGRKVGKRCVSQTEKNKNRRHCAHTIIAGTLTLSGHAGTNKLRFQGRISRARKLKPGRYKLIVTATNAAGQRSTPRSLTFTILRR